jgi:hypothetical protein
MKSLPLEPVGLVSEATSLTPIKPSDLPRKGAKGAISESTTPHPSAAPHLLRMVDRLPGRIFTFYQQFSLQQGLCGFPLARQ